MNKTGVLTFGFEYTSPSGAAFQFEVNVAVDYEGNTGIYITPGLGLGAPGGIPSLETNWQVYGYDETLGRVPLASDFKGPYIEAGGSVAGIGYEVDFPITANDGDFDSFRHFSQLWGHTL